MLNQFCAKVLQNSNTCVPGQQQNATERPSQEKECITLEQLTVATYRACLETENNELWQKIINCHAQIDEQVCSNFIMDLNADKGILS